MDVQLKPETLDQVNRVAAEIQSSPDEYVQALVETYIDHDAWLRLKTQEGLASAQRGEFVEHQEVGKLLESWFGR